MAASTSEPKTVWVEIRRPRPPDDPGQSAEGRYIVVDDVVTLTDLAGEPVRDDSGRTYTKKLEPLEDAHLIAGRLTKQFRKAIRGDNKSGFDGPLNYPKLGIV